MSTLRYYLADVTSEQSIQQARHAGLGLLTGPHRTRLPLVPVALDNGAWAIHQLDPGAPGEVKAARWDAETRVRFRDAVKRWGHLVDFVVAPDVVGWAPGLCRSLDWLPWLLDHTPRVLLAVQDGMNVDVLAEHLGPRVGLAVGGSTAWKWETARTWAGLCGERRAWCHVLRVNGAAKLADCARWGVTSADGSGGARYAKWARHIGKALGRQAPALDVEAGPLFSGRAA